MSPWCFMNITCVFCFYNSTDTRNIFAFFHMKGSREANSKEERLEQSIGEATKCKRWEKLCKKVENLIIAEAGREDEQRRIWEARKCSSMPLVKTRGTSWDWRSSWIIPQLASHSNFFQKFHFSSWNDSKRAIFLSWLAKQSITDSHCNADERENFCSNNGKKLPEMTWVGGKRCCSDSSE